MRPIAGPRVSRGQATLLAVLLAADGALVSYAELGDAVDSRGINDGAVIRQYVHRLRAAGVNCVEVVPHLGCRLTDVPPDWTLPDVLLMLDLIRSEGFGLGHPCWEVAS